MHQRSQKLFERALARIPGGVNSPVRAFGAVGGEPPFIARGDGPYVHDVDGKRYIDWVGSWGPLILGHAYPAVVEAIVRAAHDGTSFGAATAREVELAERVAACVPSIEKIRFVNSGTEATMSALRLARAFTQRDQLLKFSGCYHGHGDAFLAEAGSGVATLGLPGSAGVTAGAARDTLTVPYNDLNAVEATLRQRQVAAVIVEPAACNMGLVLPQSGFLAGLRALCSAHGTLLIFDEVITGFRVGLGGAQALCDVTPDLTTFGKIIGGGLPVGAYGGRAEIMDHVAPLGPVYQAGTLSGNPLAMAAGLATLEALQKPGVYETLEQRGVALQRGLQTVVGGRAQVIRLGSIFYLWFGQGEAPRNYAEIKKADTAQFAAFFRRLLELGVYIAPSAFEVGFVSLAHTQEHIDATCGAVEQALA